jgi:hypothetical protein
MGKGGREIARWLNSWQYRGLSTNLVPPGASHRDDTA